MGFDAQAVNRYLPCKNLREAPGNMCKGFT